MHESLVGQWLFFTLAVGGIAILFVLNAKNRDIILLDIVLGLFIICINSFVFTLPEADGDAIYYVEIAQEIANGEVCFVCTTTILSSRVISAFFYLILAPFAITTFTTSLLNYLISLIGLTLFNRWFLKRSQSNSHRGALLIVVLSPLALLYGSIPLRESLFSTLFFLLFLVAIQISRKNWIFTVPAFFVLTVLAGLLHRVGAFFAAYMCFLYFSMTYIVMNNMRTALLLNLSFLLIILAAFPEKVLVATQMGEVIYRVASDSPSSLNYPSWLVGSGFQAVLLLPIKLIYFLVSPFLFEISKASHLILVIDGLIFAYLFYHLIYRVPPEARYRRLYFGILFLTVIFAFVSANSGTSARHRNKLLLPIAFLYAVGRTKTSDMVGMQIEESSMKHRGREK